MVRSLITKGDHSVMRRANNWEAPRWVRLYVISSTRVRRWLAVVRDGPGDSRFGR